MDGFATGMDQFLVILQSLIRELKQALLLARQKAKSPAPSLSINLEKKPEKHENWCILEREHAKTRL